MIEVLRFWLNSRCSERRWAGMIHQTVKCMLPRSLLIRRLDRDASNSVLLTFDDGPDPGITQAVLKRLNKFGVRAVFFVVGRNIERGVHLLKQMQEQGHVIGNHTYIHSNGRQPWFFSYWQDVLRCQSVVEKYTGKRPKLFRPPCGIISLTTLLVSQLAGLKTVTWSLDVSDWRCRTSEDARLAAESIIQNMAGRDIILLHDNNSSVLPILDIILPVMKSQKLDLESGVELLDNKGNFVC